MCWRGSGAGSADPPPPESHPKSWRNFAAADGAAVNVSIRLGTRTPRTIGLAGDGLAPEVTPGGGGAGGDDAANPSTGTLDRLLLPRVTDD